MLRLQFYRQRRGWSQERLARLVGLHRVDVGYYERGERVPNEQRLKALADALGVYPPFLLLKPLILPDGLDSPEEAAR